MSAKSTRRGLVMLSEPASPVAEAYRVLRNGLGYINFEEDIKTLLVASAMPGEGKSTVAANLAVALSQAGKQVVLISGDFRRPASRQFPGVNENIGLSDVLTGVGGEIREVLQKPTGLEDLWVLPAGRMPPNPSELLGSRTMEKLIATMRDLADWIIVDSPPLLAVADAAVAARWADGVMMVSRAGQSTRSEAKKARAQLDGVGARIVGVTVVGAGVSTAAHDYYHRDLQPDAG